ncbi:histone deacetylase domain-containing protein [Myxozyma melibiosi]|uniref:Histone deacetylase domain-containing protein n=1 Tax=Myxozyma melibiosi TaxID=54550 RepID=A0ABR1EYV8_9ASCO
MTSDPPAPDQHPPFPSFTFTDLLNASDDDEEDDAFYTYAESTSDSYSAGDSASYNTASEGASIGAAAEGGDNASQAEREFVAQTLADMGRGSEASKSGVWVPGLPIHLGGAESLRTPATPVKMEDEGEKNAPETPAPSTPGTIDLADAISGLRIDDSSKREPEEPPKEEEDSSGKTMLLLSPLSYNHVFSRKWVAKRYLSSIVERPQRLNATALGIGAAMTLVDDDDSKGGFVLESSTRSVDLNTALHVKRVHGQKWPRVLAELCAQSEGKLAEGKIEVPDGWNSGDIYLGPGTLPALEGVVGTIEAGVDCVFGGDAKKARRCFVCVRPPGHHSHPCAPSGFCLINNVHVAIQYAGLQHDLTHAVILDFDLHHGDGSQDIVWKRSGLEDADEEFEATEESAETKSKASPKIGYFSLHDVNSFPTEVGYATAENIKNASVCLMAHDLAVWNVHLEPYSTPAEFDALYETRYSELFTKAAKFLAAAEERAQKDAAENGGEVKFKAGVFLSAGFDASEFEDKGMQRHGVHVPTSFYARFTSDSVALAERYCGGRVLSLLEGGYSDGALCSGVMAHLVGLQSGLAGWKDEYASANVVKQLEKGCKPRWHAPKSAAARENWVVRAIEVGRGLRPDGGVVGEDSGFSTPVGSALNSPVKGTPMTAGGRVLRERRSTPVYAAGGSRASPSKRVETPAPSRRVDTPAVAKHKIVREDGAWRLVDGFEKLNVQEQQ